MLVAPGRVRSTARATIRGRADASSGTGSAGDKYLRKWLRSRGPGSGRSNAVVRSALRNSFAENFPVNMAMNWTLRLLPRVWEKGEGGGIVCSDRSRDSPFALAHILTSLYAAGEELFRSVS